MLLESTQNGLQQALDRFSDACSVVGMKISTTKTETMCLSRQPKQCSLPGLVRGEAGGYKVPGPVAGFEWPRYRKTFFLGDAREEMLKKPPLRYVKTFFLETHEKILKKLRLRDAELDAGRIFLTRARHPLSEPDKRIESPISARNNVIKTQCSLVTSLLHHYCRHRRTQGGARCHAPLLALL